MQRESELIQVLAVSCELSEPCEQIEVTSVDSTPAALVALRGNQFDLLLTTLRCGESAVWPLAQKVRQVRPKLQWWLIDALLDDHDEIQARVLGVTRILSEVPDSSLIRSALRSVPLSARAANAPPAR